MTSLTGGRRCSVCSSASIRDLTMDLAAGVSGAQVAQRYGLSADSVYRHIRNQHGLSAEVITLIDGLEDSTDILERIIEIADSARNARRGALAVGNHLNAARASDSEMKALNGMVTLMGVRDSSVIETLHQMNQLIDALAKLIGAHPNVGEKLIELLDRENAHDLASGFRTLVHKALEAKKEK